MVSFHRPYAHERITMRRFPCDTVFMPKRSRRKSTPTKDENQVAFDAVSQVIALTEGAFQRPEKNAAAVALGRRGGLKGGKARAARLSPEQRRASAVKAARARWDKPQPTK